MNCDPATQLENCAHPRTKHMHGTLTGYNEHGCRGAHCKRARKTYDARHEAQNRAGVRRMVPAEPVREHIAALIATGMTRGGVQKAAGVSTGFIHNLHGENPTGVPAVTVRAANAAMVLAVTVADAKPESEIGGIGTARRLQALTALGWHDAAVAARLGVAPARVWELRQGVRVQVRTAASVARVYDEMCMTPAPVGYAATRAKMVAAKHRYLPPLAWDDDTIDDPDAVPAQRGRLVTGYAHDRYQELLDIGCTVAEIALKYGVAVESVTAALRRAA